MLPTVCLAIMALVGIILSPQDSRLISCYIRILSATRFYQHLDSAPEDLRMNIWAVLLAAISSFLLGGLWYSPILFGRIWNLENGTAPKAGHPAKVFSVSFIFSLIAA